LLLYGFWDDIEDEEGMNMPCLDVEQSGGGEEGQDFRVVPLLPKYQ